jgi:hypothetical protein
VEEDKHSEEFNQSVSQMSMSSRQKEAAMRKRDEKALSKQKKQVNLSKTPSGQKALTSQLTAKANEDLVVEEDQELLRQFARSENQAALAAMYEGCENQKEEMKYTEVDLLMAHKIKMLRGKAEITEHAQEKFNVAKLAAQKNLVVKKELMVRLMDKEDAKIVVEGEYSDTYHDVWPAVDWGITWQLEEGQTRPSRSEWDNFVLNFYFPSNAILREVKISTCFLAFIKPQRANIISWVRDYLVKKNYEMRKVGIPKHLAAAGSLVGAAIDDLKHEDMMVQYSNPREYQDRWIYPDERLRYINYTPSAILM